MKTKTFSKITITGSIVFGLVLLITLSTTNNTISFNSFAQKNNNTTNVKDTFTLSGPVSSLVYVPVNNTNNSKDVNITEQLNSMNKFV